MKKQIVTSILCLVLLLAVLGAGVWGVNGFTAPIVAENERLAAEAAAEAEKALLGDSELLYDRADEAASTLAVTADTVQSVYRDATKETYLLRLETSEGYSKQPIKLLLTIDFEGKVVDLSIEENPDDKELGEEFPQSFAGQDSTLAGVELVAGVTFSSSAIRGAVNDGFNTLIDNGLFAAAEKSDSQILNELIPLVYPGLVNKAGVPQAEELAGEGDVLSGLKATNGSGFAWFVGGEENRLAVSTALGGVTVYNTAGEDVTAAADPALVEQIAALSAANAEDFSAKDAKNFGRLLPEGTELTAIEIPGYAGCVTGAYSAETPEGTRYAFAARPYGYANEPMEFYFVLDENGAIAALRTGELILHSDYFSAYELDEASYKEGFIGLTGESYTGEQTLITGATMSSDAAASAVNDVFAAFDRLVESEG